MYICPFITRLSLMVCIIVVNCTSFRIITLQIRFITLKCAYVVCVGLTKFENGDHCDLTFNLVT